jgi:hypothetical protein
VIKFSTDRQPRRLRRTGLENFKICAVVKFTNPHDSLALAVKNQDGSSTEWDEVKVKLLAARYGTTLGFLKTVIMRDGRVIQVSAGNSND